MSVEQEYSFDVVILGGTPGGISTAISSSRSGLSVALIESHNHIGGMTTSGLGKSDIENRDMIGGIFQEFTDRVLNYYISQYGEDSKNVSLCNEGYYYEPSVAEKILEKMLSECPSVMIFKGFDLDSLFVENNQLSSVKVIQKNSNDTLQLSANLFVDATYEGDLYAKAGARYRLGRESREEYQEKYAGKIYYDYEEKKILKGSSGESDNLLPAYTYRLCFTSNPENSYRLEKPPEDYDRKHYLAYFDDLNSGRMSAPKEMKMGWGYNEEHFDTMMRVFSVTPLPNEKYDVNINPRPLGFPFPEENKGYVEGDSLIRSQICKRHRNLALGLLYFVQNDPDVSESDRQLANKYHLPKDEFQDNDHFPFQLYIREARRLVGEEILTENDVTYGNSSELNKKKRDSIAVGEFPIDSFPCQKRQVGDTRVLQGYLGMLAHITKPYQIPYGIMIPEKLESLIVPVAASTTHVAYSSIRMEPTWMAMGQAAGIACALAIKNQCLLRDVPIELLQNELIEQGQVLEH